jgi:bifunctional DNA-binding transcriptional regulator/antitoxin component of YhaV-PrlF toxin-antitoxin module
MLIKITAKRQVTFPAHVLEIMGVKPGDHIEIEEGPDGFLLKPRHIDLSRLAPLRNKLTRGRGSFNLDSFRSKAYDPKLRN